MYPTTQETIKQLTGFDLDNEQLQKVEAAILSDKVKVPYLLKGSTTIEEIVCNKMAVDYSVAFHRNKRSRKRELVDARNMAVYFYMKLFNRAPNPPIRLSLSNIGQIINIDHTTVLHGNKTISNLIATDAWFKTISEQIGTTIQMHLTGNKTATLSNKKSINMKAQKLHPGDIIFCISPSGFEQYRINAVSHTMAFAGALRFKRTVIDNIEFKLEIPARFRVPLAPTYALLNAKTYERFKLYRFNILPLFSDNTPSVSNAGNRRNTRPATHSPRANGKQPRKVYSEPHKRTAAPAQKLGAVSTPRHTITQVL